MDGLLVGVVCVAVRKSKIKRSAAVIPCNKEFLFLLGVETVAIDVVESFAEFQQQS